MIWLRCFLLYDRVALFDPIRGTIVQTVNITKGNQTRQNIQGHYTQLGRNRVYLYRMDEMLHFRVDRRDLVLHEGITARIDDIFLHRRRLALSEQGMELIQLTYIRPVRIIPRYFDSTMTAEEDVDFGIYIRNILNNPRRCHAIYRHGSF